MTLDAENTTATMEVAELQTERLLLSSVSSQPQNPRHLTDTARAWRDRAILLDYSNGEPSAALSKKYSLSQRYIRKILSEQGVRWRDGIIPRDQQINELFNSGMEKKEISELLNIKNYIVYAVVRKAGYTWAPEKINCIVCGILFVQKRYAQNVCATECRAEKDRAISKLRYSETKNRIKKTRQCLFCKKHFMLENIPASIDVFATFLVRNKSSILIKNCGIKRYFICAMSKSLLFRGLARLWGCIIQMFSVSIANNY